MNVMNHELASAKAIMLELFCGAIPIKHIMMTARRRQAILPTHLGYWIACQVEDWGVERERPQSLL